MAWTQADLDELNRLIALGAERGRFDNRDVTFRSLEEMLKLKAIMEGEIAGASIKKGPRAVRFVTDKGV